MGGVKAWALEQEERGYSQAGGDICAKCVSNPTLARWVRANLTATECRFCGRRSKRPIAANFDDFVGVVLAGISFDWNHPDNEGIMYISAEGGYQAPISSSWDVFAGYDISEDGDVVEALIDSINTDSWVERDFNIGDDSQRLAWGWDWFKHVTKHQTRYLFLRQDVEDRDDFPPSEMLDAIAAIINSDLAGLDLVKVVKPDVDLFRVRIGEAAFDQAAALGPPPTKVATQSNRMSPAGIPMFYGAFDVETAIAETFQPAVHAGQTMSIGAFRAMRDLRLLDLADLPEIPSVFDADTLELVHPLRFLHAFARDLVKPIAHDGREHIEYVPTQIVTEYFRRAFRTADEIPIDGLIYRSSRNEGGRALALFCENEQCVEAAYSGPLRDKLLMLISADHRPCPAAE